MCNVLINYLILVVPDCGLVFFNLFISSYQNQKYSWALYASIVSKTEIKIAQTFVVMLIVSILHRRFTMMSCENAFIRFVLF